MVYMNEDPQPTRQFHSFTLTRVTRVGGRRRWERRVGSVYYATDSLSECVLSFLSTFRAISPGRNTSWEPILYSLVEQNSTVRWYSISSRLHLLPFEN